MNELNFLSIQFFYQPLLPTHANQNVDGFSKHVRAVKVKAEILPMSFAVM